jgi:hypothetical protein
MKLGKKIITQNDPKHIYIYIYIYRRIRVKIKIKTNKLEGKLKFFMGGLN